jgi:hypothetical protein
MAAFIGGHPFFCLWHFMLVSVYYRVALILSRDIGLHIMCVRLSYAGNGYVYIRREANH